MSSALTSLWLGATHCFAGREKMGGFILICRLLCFKPTRESVSWRELAFPSSAARKGSSVFGCFQRFHSSFIFRPFDELVTSASDPPVGEELRGGQSGSPDGRWTHVTSHVRNAPLSPGAHETAGICVMRESIRNQVRNDAERWMITCALHLLHKSRSHEITCTLPAHRRE